MCSSQACSKLVMLQRLYACFDTCYCVSPLCKVVYSVCLYVCDYIVNNEHMRTARSHLSMTKHFKCAYACIIKTTVYMGVKSKHILIHS